MIIVKTDNKQQNFIVETSFDMNHIPRGAPNRKFIRGAKWWFLPGLKSNASYLKNIMEKERGIESNGEVAALIKKIFERSENRFTPFPVWYKFKKGVEPRKKQLEALNYAWEKSGYFFSMEMGTGKTKIYVDLSSAMFLGKKINASIIFTKNSACQNIVKEIYKHCPLLEYSVLIPEYSTKAKQKRNDEFLKTVGMKFLVVGSESLSVKKGGGKAFDYLWKFVRNNECALVIDEVHMIKNPNSNRTINFMELGGMANYRFAGTGTPVTNNLLDLYAIYQFINEDILGTDNFYSFKNRYTIRGGFKNKQIVGYENVDELMSLVKPWTFQATKADMEDLPPKIYMEPVVVPMTKEQRKIYDDIRKNKVAEIESLDKKELAVQSVLQAYMLLHQICSGFVTYLDESGKRKSEWIMGPDKNLKFKELLDILEENPGVQFNIWTKHLKELEAVYQLISKIGKTVKVSGLVTGEERNKNIDDFIEGRVKYMIATQETGGTSFTFTNCSNVVYLSNGFKYGDRIQSEDRNHRIGTKNAVTYTDIIMENSIEAKILEILKKKKSLAEYVRNELDSAIGLIK